MAIPEIQQAVRHMRAGEAEKAIPPLEQVAERMPEYVTAHVLLARMYEAAERVSDALHTWRHAFFLMPNSPVIQEGLQRTLRQSAGQVTSEEELAPVEVSKPAEAFAPVEEASPSEPVEEALAGELDKADENLDQLIEELESARIVPRPDLDEIPAPDLDQDIDDVVSETLARIYVAQEQYAEAARVYEKLAEQQPESAERFREQAAEMRERAGQ